MNGTQKIALLAMSAFLFLVASKSGSAAQWDFSESLSVGFVFTDNAELVEHDPESDLRLVVSPNFLINGKGRRLTLSLAARLQFVTGSDELFYPTMRASAHSELVKNHFFLDAFASAYQQTVNPFRPAGSPINSTGNLTTTYIVGFNPYYLTSFADFADLRVDYSYRRQLYVDDDLDNRDTNGFRVRLNSGRSFSTFSWDVYGRYERTTYEEDTRADTTFKSLDMRLGYGLTRSLAPYLTFGREWNTFESLGRRRGGPKWLVGTVWTPNPRITVDVGYGYRFFGHYPYVSLSYRHRRSALHLRYSHDLQSGYGPLDQQNLLSETDLAGNPVDPFAGDPLDANNSELTSVIEEGANVNKHLDASYLLFGRRTSFGIKARYSNRNYVDDFRDLIEWRLRFNVNRSLARQLSVGTNLSWRRTEDKFDFQSDTWDLRFHVTRGLGNHTNLTFSYTYSQRDSNRLDDDYTENRIALVLTTSMVGLAKHADLL